MASNDLDNPGSSSSPTKSSRNPLAFLGLKRVGHDDDDETELDPDEDRPSGTKIELNRRGLPARKRKKNSLIYSNDEVVEMPTKSPKKKTAKTERLVVLAEILWP